MEKIALITDTTSDLPNEIINEHNINVLPFRIIYEDREYKDRVDITPEEVYSSMVEKGEVPTSSMPALDDVDNLFTKLENEGYTHAIVITISSKLSGAFNGIKLVSEDHPKIKTHIFDSKSISIGEGILVRACANLIKEGKSYEEIVNELPNVFENTNVFFVVPTLEYLKRGGRIGKVAGTIAEILDIKPIITPDKDGNYSTYAKTRGRKKSLNKLIKIVKGFLDEKRCRVYILHGNALEDAKMVYNELKDYNNLISIEFEGSISPVSGVHSGPGLVGIGIFGE